MTTPSTKTTHPAAGVTDLGLPQTVKFCRNCVVSNQRPSSTVEFRNVNLKETIAFADDGLCSACRYHEMKYKTIDWAVRHQEFLALLDRHRSNTGAYDVIVPGSGGKDSVYVAHVLKTKYGMNPLTVTWPPHMYTAIGWKNFEAWLDCGFDNISFHPNRRVHRMLTRLAFLNLLHPFQPFILGQKQIGPKVALRYGVPLIMYGESQAEGGSNIEEAFRPVMDRKYYTLPAEGRATIRLGGRSLAELADLGVPTSELAPYIPITPEEAAAANIEVHHLGYYELWRPQDKYYYAVEHCGFTPNPERTEGTYSKYSSLDDRIDGFHYFTTHVKFGIGRATYDAAQEIRNHHLTREEGVALVRRFDGEFPKRYFPDFLEYTGISEDDFWQAVDRFRSPHLWEKNGNDWKLRHVVE